MPRLLYRGRQVWQALRTRIDPDRLAAIDDVLSHQEASLFQAMERRDQRHALEVTHRLLAAGVQDRDILKAAMLHDCGKGSVPVWLRIVKVLAPRLVRAAARPGASSWRGAAYRITLHAQIGARAAEQAGASPLTVRLISGQVGSEDAAKLELLTAADDVS